VGPFTYSWSPSGITAAIASGLTPGQHLVLVNGTGVGCTFTAQSTVGAQNYFSLTVSASTPVCNGASTGTAIAITSGGSGVFTYTWSGLSQTTSSVSGLSSNNYTVFVKDTLSQCVLSKTFVINQSPPMLLSVTPSSSVVCTGDSVQLTPNVVGGFPSFSYSWQSGPGVPIWTTSSASPGNITYSLTVTDSQSCIATASTSVLFNPFPVIGTTTLSICLG
jgi:hypothetical protein